MASNPKINKQKLAIIGLWFLMLTGVRYLLAITLANIWLGTFGAVALTFAFFYLVIKYTPLRMHAHTVNAILSEWYQRKYFLLSAIATSTLLAGLLLLTEYGYLHFGPQLFLFDVFNSDDKMLEDGMRNFGNYSFLDKMAVIVASTDKSLDGNYSKTTSFLLAEDLEMLSFMLVLRKKKNLFC